EVIELRAHGVQQDQRRRARAGLQEPQPRPVFERRVIDLGGRRPGLGVITVRARSGFHGNLLYEVGPKLSTRWVGIHGQGRVGEERRGESARRIGGPSRKAAVDMWYTGLDLSRAPRLLRGPQSPPALGHRAGLQ